MMSHRLAGGTFSINIRKEKIIWHEFKFDY